MEKAVYSILAANSGVGALCADRIYPVVAPQNATYPCVIYARDTIDYVDGIQSSTTLRHAIIELVCVAATYIDVKALSKAVRDALNRYVGTIGGVTVEDIFIEDEHDEFDDTLNNFVVSISIRGDYTE